MISRDEKPYSVFFASCYDHGGVSKSWIDVVFGTWGQGEANFTDHLTFGCRFGPVESSDRLVATAVDGASVAPDGPLYGKKLSRKAALRHPMPSEFWLVVDFVAESDPLVRRHHYDHEPRLA